jgi:hypothetical protein
MSRSISTKAALIAALVGAALIGRPNVLGGDWIGLSLVAFGAINVIFSPPGTLRLRIAAIVVTLLALVGPDAFAGAAVLLALLAYPPALLVAWALARNRGDWDNSEHVAVPVARPRARAVLAAIIAAVGVASAMYRGLVWQQLHQTAALFIGIPVILAIIVVLWVSPRSATGVACKAVSVGMLVSLMFLGEGMVCVLMAAPLFYAVAILIGISVDVAQRRVGPTGRTVSCIALLAFAPMSFEGVTDVTSFDRIERVVASKIVQAPSHAVARAIFEQPRFDRPLPMFLRAGFPRPIASEIQRAGHDMTWLIRMRGGEMRLDGVEPATGDLILRLEESRPGFVRWRALRDDSHLTHYLSWRDACVEWHATGTDTTRVTWTLIFSRDLDPAWYFGPWERYATQLAAEYLIDAVATP